MKKIHNANSWEDEFLASCMCFLTFLKKWKSAFLLLNFLKQVLWTWKYVQKKLVIGPDFHQNFYPNRVISQKYMSFLNPLIFFFDLTVRRYSAILICSRCSTVAIFLSSSAFFWRLFYLPVQKPTFFTPPKSFDFRTKKYEHFLAKPYYQWQI